jgi:hypothetical protein
LGPRGQQTMARERGRCRLLAMDLLPSRPGVSRFGRALPGRHPAALRRVSYFDRESNQRLKFLTNNFVLPAFTLAQIYEGRWQVELFFQGGPAAPRSGCRFRRKCQPVGSLRPLAGRWWFFIGCWLEPLARPSRQATCEFRSTFGGIASSIEDLAEMTARAVRSL